MIKGDTVRFRVGSSVFRGVYLGMSKGMYVLDVKGKRVCTKEVF